MVSSFISPKMYHRSMLTIMIDAMTAMFMKTLAPELEVVFGPSVIGDLVAVDPVAGDLVAVDPVAGGPVGLLG